MALAIIQLNTNGIRNPDKRAGLLFVSKRLTVLVTSSVSPGFVLLPFIVLCLLVLKSPVVVSFFFVLVCPLSIFRLMMLVVLCCVSSVFKANCLVLSPCMRPIVTLQGTSFLIKFPLGSIQQCPLSCGNFNTVFDRSLDRTGSVVSDTSRDSTSILSHLFDDCCVIDIWRYLHPSSSGYTWMHLDGSVFSRIDLVGCPYVWVPSVSSCEIILCPFSDHCAVLLCVTVPDVVPPGPRLWKLNTSILEESDYVRQIEILWSRWRDQKERFPSLAKWWEASKSRIKEVSINYCCAKSSDNAVDRPSFQARFAP